MDRHRLSTIAERHGWLLVSATIAAGVLLLSLTVSEGAAVGQGAPDTSTPFGWPRLALLWLSGGAVTVCLAVMVLVIAAEAHRMRAFHQSLDWVHARRTQRSSLESERDHAAPANAAGTLRQQKEEGFHASEM